MSNPPPGLGGGGAGAVRGPPPGFGAPQTPASSGRNAGSQGEGQGGTAVIVRAQVAFYLTTLTEESFEKASVEVRALASSHGPEMYHHYLRRASHTAQPILSKLIDHSQQYQDDPAAPPPNIPSTGQAALAWRLLVTEAARAARDVMLAPHFALTMLSSSGSPPLPLPSIRLFNLPPAYLFSLTAYTLAAPHVFPPTHPSIEVLRSILRQTLQPSLELLRSPGIPFWSINSTPNYPPSSEDLTLQEARSLILAVYPKSSAPSSNNPSRPPTPTNPTAPHSSLLNSSQRGALLSSISVKFSSPAIILQTLSALVPGGPPRGPETIPLEDILFELGENLTQDEGTVEAVIRRWWAGYILDSDDPNRDQLLSEEAGNSVYGLCEGFREGRMVDIHGVVKGLCAIEGISFPEVIRAFDRPNTVAAYRSSLPLFIPLLLMPPQTPQPPLAGLLPADLESPIWTNMSSLLAVLFLLTSLAPDHLPLFTMPNAPPPHVYSRIIDPPATDGSISKAAMQQAAEIQGAGLWNTLGLVQILVAACGMADEERVSEETAEVGRRATELLDKAAGLASELVVVALERLKKPLPAPVANLHSRLLSMYLSSTTSSDVTSRQLVFHQLYTNDPARLLQILSDFYNEDQSNLGLIIDIGLEVQILDKLLASDNLLFALDIAALAANKEYLDFEKWLADAVDVKDEDFLQGVFEFAEYKIGLEMEHQHQSDNVPAPPFPLGQEVYATIIRVVRNARKLEREDIGRFKRLRTDILIIHPRLLNLRPNSKEEQGYSVAKFSKEITAQNDEMYRRMYAEELKLDDVIAELKRYQSSDDPREQELFASALHAVFDEYKFVKAYPAKELTMTGILFGAIIDFRLVKDIPAFVVTRYVLDAIKTPPQEPLYQFGINALSVLRGSLVDFPGLCRSLLEIPALHESHPVLINDIVSALQEREDLDLQGGVKLAFPALKLPILVEEGDDEHREPEPAKKDQFMFIINQIAPSNYQSKAEDLVKVFEDQYSRWFAHYFIDVRVALEANRHDIYMKVLEEVNSPVLERHVLWETLRKARDLLNSEATISSASERTTLKTVAMWLGRLTLARNKPIRMKELSVKDLLIQGYDNKRLIVAIPFVCNLMMACKESSVFHPPNPWMLAVIRLLVEFYHFAELRLNLKFEIEVLLSKLDIKLESIEPSDLLRTHLPPPPPQPELPNRLDLEYQKATSELLNGAQRFEPPVDPAFARMQAFQSEQAAQAAQEAFVRRIDELVAALPEVLVFSGEYPIFTAPTGKRIVHHSIDRAIREIINPVVERSVTIAGISSRDLVQKDFGMEGDAQKMRHSAHLMVQNLAGNLAIVTCKEPLRTAMITNIRSMLGQNGFTEDNMPDAMISGVVNDNIDAGCSVIKKAAMEKAAKDIDVNLAPQYAARRAHREARSQQPFWDGGSFGVAISHSALPDSLRIRSGGLTPSQLRVYEDFGEHTRIQPQSNGDYGGYQQQAQQSQRDELGPGELKRGPSPMYSETPGPNAPSPQVMPAQTSLDKFQELVAELERLIAQTPADSLMALPADHDIRQVIRTVIIIAHSSANREGTTLIISQKVVQLLYKSQSPLGREVYTLTLQNLCELSRKVDKEVKQWLIYAEDSRKFNVPVTVILIRVGFISVADLDTQLAQVIIRSFAPELLDFVANLVRECSLSNHAMVPRDGFASSLAALLKAQELGNANESVDSLLEDLRGPRPAPVETITEPNHEIAGKSQIDAQLQERLAHYFLEWVREYSTSKNPESSFVGYITYLQKEGILSGEDVSSAFYRTAINCAVDLDSGKLDDTGRFYGTDSLAKLIVLIIKNYGDKSGTSSVTRTVYYFNKIITIMSYSLVQRQLDESFTQRPWSRFFTSLLSELQTIEHSLPETYYGCLKSFANNLGITQPTYAPRFAFGWLSIISHRFFMAKLLSGQEEGWTDYHRCLMWLLRFMAPFFKTDMAPSSRSMYHATIRVLLVLMHDFPDFLVEYYHTLATAIPPHCVQLRNIVLSAFPSTEGPLPDYYKPLDQLIGEMQRFPKVRLDYTGALSSGGIRAAIDQHVRTNSPPLPAIVGELKNRIAIKSMGADGNMVITWNHTLLHAAVYYLGTTAISRRATQAGIAEFDSKAPEVAILASLAFALDAEGQYYLLSVIADQLRFPSAHTLFYIHFVLFLFGAASRAEVPNQIAERISRVLLERVITAKPHPWGLVITFVELLENESYGFWKQSFVRAEEEIYLFFLKAQRSFVGGAHR